MRSYLSRVGLLPMTGVLVRNLDNGVHREEHLYDGGRDWGDASTHQGMPRDFSRRAKMSVSLRVWKYTDTQCLRTALMIYNCAGQCISHMELQEFKSLAMFQELQGPIGAWLLRVLYRI